MADPAPAWLTRPEMDRLERKGLLPEDVDRVWVSSSGHQATVFWPIGREQWVRATTDPFRESDGGPIWWAALEEMLGRFDWKNA